MHSLLLFGNNRDRIKTSTQCAEWSLFAISFYVAMGFKSSDISDSGQQYTVAANACLWHRPIYSCMAESRDDAVMKLQLIRLPLCGWWCVFLVVIQNSLKLNQKHYLSWRFNLYRDLCQKKLVLSPQIWWRSLLEIETSRWITFSSWVLIYFAIP